MRWPLFRKSQENNPVHVARVARMSTALIAERLSARRVDSLYVCIRHANARMSHLGMQFYTTCQRTRLYQGRRK